MTDFPTVGLKVDLSGIDQGEAAYARLKTTIEGVGEAADKTSRSVSDSAAKVKEANQGAAQSAVDRASTSARASSDETRASASASVDQQRQAREVQQARIASIEAVNTARRAADLQQAASSASSADQMAKSGAIMGATSAETENYRQRVIAATMAQAGLSEAQARAALGYKDATTATRAATAALTAEGVERMALDAATKEQLATRMGLTRQMSKEEIDQAALRVAAIAAEEKNATTSAAQILAFRQRMWTQQAKAQADAIAADKAAQAADDAAALSASKRAAALLGSLDPTTKAQQQLNTRIAEANALFAQGAITQDQHTLAVGRSEAAFKKATNALGLTTAGLGAYEVREIAVSGREILTGNFTRLAGTASILAGRFGLLNILFDPMVLGFIGLAGVAVAAEVAISKYSDSIQRLDELSQGVGAKVGLTGAAIQKAGETAAAAADVSIASATSMAAAYAASGKMSSDSIEQLTSITELYSRATGETAKQATVDLAKAMTDQSGKAIEEVNDKLSFLNGDQLEHIQNLLKANDLEGAQKQILADLVPFLEKNIEQLGGVAGGWHDIFTWASNAGKAIQTAIAQSAGVGQVGDRLAALQRQRDFPILGTLFAPQLDRGISRLQNQRAVETVAAQTRDGQAAAFAASDNATKALNTLTPGQGSLIKLTADLGTVNHALDDLKKTGQDSGPVFEKLKVDQEAYTNAVTSYKDPAAKAHDIAKAQLEVTEAHTAAQKAAAASDLAKAKSEGEVLTNQQLATKATDAATEAEAKKLAQHRQDPVANRLATLAAEAAGNRDVASAADISTAAGFRAVAISKAMVDAARTHGQEKQFEAAEILLAVTATEKEAATYITKATEKTKVTDEATASMALYGYSLQTANQRLADQQELDKIGAALANATGDDRDRLTKQLLELTLAQLAYNDALQRQHTQEELNANLNTAEMQSLEVEMLGKTNAERNIAIAQLKEIQKLTAEGVDPKSFNGQVRIAGATLGAQNQNTTDAATAAYTKQLNAQADAWAAIADSIDNASARLSDFFGTFGTGIGALLTGLANEAKALEEIRVKWLEAQKAGDQRQMANLDRQAAAIRIQSYGDTAEAAASMFGKQTAAYKILHAAEEAFRIFQLAMQAKAIIGYFAEAAAHTATTATQVGNDAISMGSTTAKDTAAATTGAAAGAAQMFADLGPLGFAAVAAMTAVLAGFGLFSGGGSPGVAPGTNDAVDRQKAQGAGTILGDATAKSDSIAKSLSIVAANTNTDLQYSDKMLSALRSIDSNIGTLTAALAQSLSLGQLSGSSGLGLGSSTSGPGLLTRLFAPLSNLLPGLFSTSKTTTLQDQGLQFSAQTIGDIITKGIQGAIFQQTSTETKSKFFGITTSDKFSQNTSTSGIESGVADDLTRVIASLRSGVLAAASVLGITGAQATLDAFNLDLGKISLKDLKGQDLTDAINAIFSKAADQMAADVLPIVSQFQQAGEGAFQTLTRLAKDYETVDISLQAIGKTFGAVGLASVGAREDLISLFGGLDNFTQAVSDFSNDFLTDAQKLAPIQDAVAKEMASLGLSGITTKASFVALVQGLDLTTVAGRTMYAELLQVAPAFAKVADAMTAAVTSANDNVDSARQALQAAHDAAVAPYEKALGDLQNQVSTARQNLTTAYNAESQALNATISSMKNLSTALRTFRASLDTGPNAQPSPQDAYFGAKALFQSTSAAAAGGDHTALGNLQNVEQAFLDASKSYFASSDGYFKDLADVKAATTVGADAADNQAKYAQEQLDALNKLVAGLIPLNDNTLSVVQAIAALNGAINDQSIVQGIIDSIDAQTDPLLKINASVLTIPQAIAALQAALEAQAAAQAAVSKEAADAALAAANAALALANSPQNPANTPSPAAPAGPTATTIGDLVKARPDITAEYNRLLGQADWNSPWMNQHGLFQNGSVNDFAEWWYYKGGGSSEFQFLTPPPMTHPDLGFSKGGAFDNGQIVGQETTFDIATMSEDGPEAIMPLARTAGGQLGVYTSGSQSMDKVVEQLQALTDEVKMLKVVNQQGHLMANEKLDDLIDETAGVTTAVRQAAA